MAAIKEALKHLDGRTERAKKLKAYLTARARPLKEKTVTCRHMPSGKNAGVPETVTLIAGKCPCSICGHEWMMDCEDNNCECCSSVCT